MVLKYEWGMYRFPIAAEIVGKRCEKLEQEHKKLSNDILLDSARNEDDELHCLFEWNDSIAAEKYRLHQAGRILSSLKVSVVEEDKPEEEPKQVKAFLQVSRENHKAVYMNAAAALKNEDTRNRVLEIALSELSVFRQKYKTLQELSAVMAAIDEVLNEQA